jgi:hypothetical protein
MKKAATIDAVITFTDANGLPLNITNCSVRFMIKTAENLPDNAALLNKNANVTDAVKGKATAQITYAESATLPNNKPLFMEAVATYLDNTVVRTETLSFVLTTNLIKSLV